MRKIIIIYNESALPKICGLLSLSGFSKKKRFHTLETYFNI